MLSKTAHTVILIKKKKNHPFLLGFHDEVPWSKIHDICWFHDSKHGWNTEQCCVFPDCWVSKSAQNSESIKYKIVGQSLIFLNICGSSLNNINFGHIDFFQRLLSRLPGASASKESTCNAGDLGLTPGLGRSPGGGNGNPVQCSCLENLPGRLQSLGSQTVGDKWATNTHTLCQGESGVGFLGEWTMTLRCLILKGQTWS